MIYYLFSLALRYQNNIYWNKKKNTKETASSAAAWAINSSAFCSHIKSKVSYRRLRQKLQWQIVKGGGKDTKCAPKLSQTHTHTHTTDTASYNLILLPHPGTWRCPPPCAVAFFLSLSQLATLHVNFCRLRPCIDKKIHKILGIRAKKRNGREVRRRSRRRGRGSRSWEIQSDSSRVCQQPWKWHLSSANFGNLLI